VPNVLPPLNTRLSAGVVPGRSPRACPSFGRCAWPTVTALLVLGAGLPWLALLRAEDVWAQGALVLATLLVLVPILRRALRAPAADAATVAPGPWFDRACRQQRDRIRRHGGRLTGHANEGARATRLTQAQVQLLQAAFDAALPLWTGDTPGRETLVRIDLEGLDSETGRHLRLRLAGCITPGARCDRHLRQVCTRLGAQLDIARDGEQLQVELVLPTGLPARA
jgi:hypothetical protein